MPRLDGYGILRQRDYRRFWLGQWISLIGTWMQSATQGWLLIKLTNSPMWLGALGAASGVPLLVFVLVGGAASERWDRRRIILCTQLLSLLQALVLAVLTLRGHIQPWQVIALAAVLGAVNAFDIPARQAFVVELVGPERVGNAIALNSSAFNIARVIGPAVGGLIVAAVGEGYCFLINAVSYVAVLWSLATIRAQFASIRRRELVGLAAIADGLRYVVRHPRIRPVLLLVGVISSVGVPYRNFLPAMAHTVLGANDWQYGLLLGAAGAGATIGGLILAAFHMRRDAYLRLLPISVVFFSVTMLAFAAMRTYWPSLALLIFVGVGGILYFNCSNSLIQLSVDDGYRGRVMSVYTLMHQGTAAFGNVLLGMIASQWGTPSALATGAILCLGGTAIFLLTGAHRARVGVPAGGPSLRETIPS